MVGAALLSLVGCASPPGPVKTGGPTDTKATCGVRTRCEVAIRVAGGCEVTVMPFALHIQPELGRTTIVWKLARDSGAGWVFDDRGIDFGETHGEFFGARRVDDFTFAIGDNNMRRAERFAYHVRLRNRADRCVYDPLVINDP